MATTTNYGWTTPDDTALVKDGASAIRTLGTSVDTTTKNLNPQTTLGDIAYRSSTSNVNTRLGIGTSGQALTVVAGAPSWAASPTSVLTTTGDTLYASAANTLARLGIGSTGQVLTVASGLPSWATSSSGGMTLISTTTLTGASVTLSSIPATYNDLVLIFQNPITAVDGDAIYMRINSDANARYRSTQYLDIQQLNVSFHVTRLTVTPNADSSVGQGLINFEIPNYANTTTWKTAQSYGVTNNSTTNTNGNLFGFVHMFNQIGAISSLTIFGDTGNLTSGTVLLYGVK